MKAQGINYYEVSAKTGRNLNEMFKSLCSILMNVPVDRIIDNTQKPQTEVPKSTVSKGPVAPVTPKAMAAVEVSKSTVLKNPNSTKGPDRIKQRNCC